MDVLGGEAGEEACRWWVAPFLSLPFPFFLFSHYALEPQLGFVITSWPRGWAAFKSGARITGILASILAAGTTSWL